MCVCVWIYGHGCQCPQRPEVLNSPRAGVVGSCEPRGIGSGNWTLTQLLGPPLYLLAFLSIFPSFFQKESTFQASLRCLLMNSALPAWLLFRLCFSRLAGSEGYLQDQWRLQWGSLCLLHLWRLPSSRLRRGQNWCLLGPLLHRQLSSHCGFAGQKG